FLPLVPHVHALVRRAHGRQRFSYSRVFISSACGVKILIIPSYFGPETSVGVLRVSAFANHWSRQGHEVHVLTMPFSGEMPAGLRDNPRIHVQQIAPWLIRGSQAADGQGFSKGVKGWRRALLSFQYWLKRRLLSNYLDPRVLWWPRA